MATRIMPEGYIAVGGAWSPRSPRFWLTLALLTFEDLLRRPSVADSRASFMVRFDHEPGSGTARSMAMSKRSLVLSPSGVRVYLPSCERNLAGRSGSSRPRCRPR